MMFFKDKPMLPAPGPIMALALLCSIVCLDVKAAPAAGDTQTFGEIEFLWCPPGTFTMGSPTSPVETAETFGGFAEWYSDEFPVNEVTIEKGFWLSRTEITQEQWSRITGERPWQKYGISDAGKQPATGITGEQALDFTVRLGESVNKLCRLPVEAEWEYAARAGAVSAYYFGDSPDLLGQHGWYRWNSSGGTIREVGGMSANPWGFLDILGNAWEWTGDMYSPESGDTHGSVDSHLVLRGGGVNSTAPFLRCSFRIGYARNASSPVIGVRVLIEE